MTSLSIESGLLNDKQVAKIVCMSPQWVRQERFKLNHQQPHSFNVKPVYIGRCPRYRVDDVQDWLQALPQGNAACLNQTQSKSRTN